MPNPLNVFFAALLEQALNRALALREEPMPARLVDKVVALELKGLGLHFHLQPHARGLDVSADYPGMADAEISAAPFTLLRVLLQPESKLAGGSEMHIRGEVATAQYLFALFRELNLDWEELLSRFAGDTPARWTGRNARQAGEWSRQTRDSLEQNLGEYLREEARLLPTPEQVAEFIEQTDVLRADCDRLAQRIARLEQRLAADKPGIYPPG